MCDVVDKFLDKMSGYYSEVYSKRPYYSFTEGGSVVRIKFNNVLDWKKDLDDCEKLISFVEGILNEKRNEHIYTHSSLQGVVC